MVMTLLITELLAGKELHDLIMARKSCCEMKAISSEDDVEWSITQAYYANLGGYVLEFQNMHRSEQQTRQKSDEKVGDPIHHDVSANAALDLVVAAERIFKTQNQGLTTTANGFKIFFS
ncbi:hypothetical protein N431DRAFT_485720 [Stipitochalara longipes BDJ]|nr:hypothetical protein N431DRAFT_485720 [Stipitochalara longipes BDJ]